MNGLLKEIKAILAMLMLMAALVIFVVYEYDVTLIIATGAAIAGLGGYTAWKGYNNSKK